MHFSVLAVGRSIEDIESVLEKYDSELEVENYLSVSFDEIVDKYLNLYYSGYKKIIEDYQKDPANYKFDPLQESYARKFLSIDFSQPEETVRKNIYDSFAYCWGGEVREDGVYSKYNPESQWDWYEFGGRFSGKLLLSDFAEPIRLGERVRSINFFDELHLYRYYKKNRADVAYLCDVVNLKTLLDSGCINSIVSRHFGWVELEGKNEDDLEYYYQKIISNGYRVIALVDCHI